MTEIAAKNVLMIEDQGKIMVKAGAMETVNGKMISVSVNHKLQSPL